MATQLSDYTKDELLAYAEEFGVEVKSAMTKAAIIAEFDNDGVDVALIKGLHPEQVEEDVEEDAPVEIEEEADDDDDADLVLIKMTRLNASYEVRGYKFNREHPFALVKENDADYLIEVEGGFAMASPKEARAFYS
jgi:hypothetical protein